MAADETGDGSVFSTPLRAGYRFAAGDWQIVPVASLSSVWADIDSHGDLDNGLPLTAHGRQRTTLQPSLGLGYRRTFSGASAIASN